MKLFFFEARFVTLFKEEPVVVVAHVSYTSSRRICQQRLDRLGGDTDVDDDETGMRETNRNLKTSLQKTN